MSHTIIHLVRHGEVYNPDRILYGRIPDYHLSARGQSMAAATAQSFANHDIALLWSSPLERAQETAGGNRFEGLRVNSWRSQLINPIRWPLMWNPALPSWGEHYVDIAARMMDAVDSARRQAAGHEGILVTHQLPIVCVQRTILGQPLAHNPSNRVCDLASVTSLVFRGDQLVDYRYNEPAQEI